MNDKSHSIPGQTSDFELRLIFPGVAPSEIPVDGRYVGWFMIKNPQKNSSTKIEDKDLDIKFTKKENSSDFDVAGTGINKFGKFSIQGTLKSNNMIQLYKIYQPKRALGATPRGSVGGSPRPRVNRQVLSSVSSPRESSSRIRRPSLALAESLAPTAKATVNKPVVQRASSKSSTKTSVPSSTTSRSSRPPPFVSKCKDLLKDMMKQVSAVYFAEPVDFVKFGIPDYPTIIKEPMDFSTIRSNLDKQVYKSHEMFCEHMRLVFKNAITYNVRRDNPVHIAARELSDMFEEKYRMMVSQLGTAHITDAQAPPLNRQSSSTGGRKSGGGKGGRGRGSHGGGSGPRPMEVAAPPALDGSMQQMMLMHQKMLDMEQELNSLRTAVRQTEIRTSLDQQRVAAQIPLSYDEKKALIENIQRLDGDQITAVVDIIQSAMPSTDCGGEGDEVEIPMDELDTYTLRQLQDYVHSIQQQTISFKRKRQSMTSSSTRSPRGKKSKSVPSVTAMQIPNPSSLIEMESNQLSPAATSSNGGNLGEDFPVQGRKRSNSLDLFPSDDMEMDPIVTGSTTNQALEDWTMPTNGGNIEPDNTVATKNGGESWGEAVSERKDILHRESEKKIQSEKLSENRAKVEKERNNLLNHSIEEQSSTHADHNRAADLLAQRESERSKRAEMSQTIEFDESHDALYQDSLDL